MDNWRARWQAGGRAALLSHPRGRRAGERQVLSQAEQAAVRQAVLDHTSSELGLSGQLWTRARIGELIFKLYRVRFAEPGVGKYLKRWGLTFQRPDKRASFDAKIMCRFPDRIVGHFVRKVHLVVDRHSAHRSKTTRARLADHKDRIELHFLPSYSPELNPDELVNADLKRSLPHTHRARNQTEPAAETWRFFHRRQHQPRVVHGYFGGQHVRYVIDA